MTDSATKGIKSCLCNAEKSCKEKGKKCTCACPCTVRKSNSQSAIESECDPSKYCVSSWKEFCRRRTTSELPSSRRSEMKRSTMMERSSIRGSRYTPTSGRKSCQCTAEKSCKKIPKICICFCPCTCHERASRKSSSQLSLKTRCDPNKYCVFTWKELSRRRTTIERSSFRRPETERSTVIHKTSSSSRIEKSTGKSKKKDHGPGFRIAPSVTRHHLTVKPLDCIQSYPSQDRQQKKTVKMSVINNKSSDTDVGICACPWFNNFYKTQPKGEVHKREFKQITFGKKDDFPTTTKAAKDLKTDHCTELKDSIRFSRKSQFNTNNQKKENIYSKK